MKSVVMYLEKIHREPDETDADIANNVRRFSREQKLNLRAVQVVRNWRSDDVVGCRLVIPETMAPRVTTGDFWPDGIKCRPWQKRKPKNDRSHNSSAKHKATTHKTNAAESRDVAATVTARNSDWEGLQYSPISDAPLSSSGNSERQDWWDYGDDQSRYNDTDYGYHRGDVHISEDNVDVPYEPLEEWDAESV